MELQNSILDDLAAVIGFSATARLAAWYGHGNSMYVPISVEESQTLVRLIGLPAAKALTKSWPGQFLSLHPLRGYEQEVVRYRVSRMTTMGATHREIASIVGLGERRVQQIQQELLAAGLLTNSVGKVLPEKPPAKIPQEKGASEIPRGFFTTK
jgi:hypothetical protein